MNLPPTTTDPTLEAIRVAARLLATTAALHRAAGGAAEIAIKSNDAHTIRQTIALMKLMVHDLNESSAVPGQPMAES